MLNLRGRTLPELDEMNFEDTLTMCREFLLNDEPFLHVHKPRMWGKTHLLCTLLMERPDSYLLISNLMTLFLIVENIPFKVDQHRITPLDGAHNVILGREVNLLLLDEVDLPLDSLLRQRNYKILRLFS